MAGLALVLSSFFAGYEERQEQRLKDAPGGGELWGFPLVMGPKWLVYTGKIWENPNG